MQTFTLHTLARQDAVSAGVLPHEGQDHYFCCPSCRRLFASHSEQFFGSATAASDQGDPTDEVPG